MKKIYRLLVTIVILWCCFAFLASPMEIRLDGKADEAEWKDAQKYELKNGGSMLVRKGENEIWVSLESSKKGWVQIYISAGDTIRVLHASAALGEARYVKQKQLWHAIQDFKYELRDRGYNEQVAAKQQDYFQKFGWTANNNNTGDGKTFEFKIDLLRFGRSPVAMAYLILDDPNDPHYFPVTVNDHTILPRLMQGYTPDSLSFDTGSWQKIR